MVLINKIKDKLFNNDSILEIKISMFKIIILTYILNLIDGIQTYISVGFYNAVELNPIMVYIFNVFGILIGIIITKFFIVGLCIIILIYNLKKFNIFLKVMFFLIYMLYIFIVINNFNTLFLII